MFFKSALRPSRNLVAALGDTWSDEEIASLDRMSTRIDLPAGTTLATEGRIGQEVLVILSGSAAVSRGAEILATVGKGTIIGERAVFTGERRNADVIATTDVVAQVMSAQEFRSLLNTCPRLERLTRWLVAERQA